MAIVIRHIRSGAEEARHGFISAYAFNGDRGDEALARRTQYYDRDWLLGAFDGDELVAGLTVIPFEQYINGAPVPLGGVASVSCLPERRREGLVGALLRESLSVMRERGQWLSGLYTPHPSLYRKYGWEMAGRIMSYSFPPKEMRTRQPMPRGSFRRVDGGEWRLLDAIYTRHASARNGALVRDERRWRMHVFSDYGKGDRDAAVWSNAAGEPRGYAVYRAMNRPPAGGAPFGETVLRVVDWTALDAEAYAAVLGYLLSHDLVSQIIMLASQEEPLTEAFKEPVHIKEPPGAWPGMMLRLVDVQRALEARPALPQASGKAVTLAIEDATAPWNAGTWRIESSEGRISAERTETAADAEMDVRALAPIHNGFLRPADAVRVGSVRALNPSAIPAMTAIFSTSFAPFCPDDF